MNRTKDGERFHVPLMFAFREAFRERDARERLDERREGERVLSARGSLKRRGAADAKLRENLALDIVALFNTIDLASAVDLDGLPRVAKSVLNYGLFDVSHLTSQEAGVDAVAANLRAAINHHEPRLRPESLLVERDTAFDDVNQRIRFRISAEMSARPFDIPVEFVAELEISSGKLKLANGGRAP